MSTGKIVLAGTIGAVAVVVKLVHDMQVNEKAEMRSGVERDKARRLEKRRLELQIQNSQQIPQKDYKEYIPSPNERN